MTLLRAADISLSFGSRTIFDKLTFTIEAGERVGLVGVNGSGKSTLMKVLARELAPDSGELQLRRGASVTYLPQEPSFAPGATALSALGTDHHEAKAMLDRLGVREFDRPVDELSGGQKKRVALARALLSKPDLLLLDEPTNHLDADTVEWLEEEIDSLRGALLLVTHDRYFLDDLVDRIVELGPGPALLTSYPGNYEAYLEQKLVAMEHATVAQHKRERWIAQEVAWLRKGVEARRTKSKARIERARKLLAERGFQPPKVAALQAVQAPRLSQTVIEGEHLSKKFGERTVLDDVGFILQGGERVGLVGRNGAGKTTFLRVVTGELKPDAGKLVIGEKTRIAYYDQARSQLDPEQTVFEAASYGEEHVEIGGKSIALRDYLDDLLFPVPMQRMQVKALSGGERNRLLLARLFLEGANVLVLDEPTNDLDIVTLNVLEHLLLDFRGSVLLVTHDRYFLDKVATSILAFEGDGKVTRYPGNFEMYKRLRKAPEAAATAKKSTAPAAAAASKSKPAKLGYLEQRELDGIEPLIERAEARKAQLEADLASPQNATNAARLAELSKELEAATAEVDRLYARWQELSARVS